jgi:pimeloyl-ACP methyl ester carboxylesterase
MANRRAWLADTMGPQYSEDIACLLRERVGAPAVLFGHSLGGMLAMWVASHHPELVRALILGDNIIAPRQLRNPMYTALFTGLRDLARRGGSVEQIADGIGNIVLPAPERTAGCDPRISRKRRSLSAGLGALRAAG